MKKKFAFILAAVIMLSTFPALGLSAATDVTVIGFEGLPKHVLIPANGYAGESFKTSPPDLGSIFIGCEDNEVEYVSKTMSYSIEKNNGLANGFRFVLTLTPDTSGAKFLYGYPMSSNANDVNFPVYSQSLSEATGKSGFKVLESDYGDNGYDYLEYWVASVKDGVPSDYCAFIIQPRGRTMYITLTCNDFKSRDLDIPMAVYIGEESDVSVYVSQQSSSVISTSSQKINNLFSSTGSRIYIDEVKTVRDHATLADIIITETTRGILRNNGWVKFTLTKGFEFVRKPVTAKTEYKSSEFGYKVTFNEDCTEMYVGFWNFAETGFNSKFIISGIEIQPSSDRTDTGYNETMVILTAENADAYYDGDTKISPVTKLNISKTTFNVAKFTFAYANGDINKDGFITTADAVLLLQYIAKIIPSLP